MQAVLSALGASEGEVNGAFAYHAPHPKAELISLPAYIYAQMHNDSAMAIAVVRNPSLFDNSCTDKSFLAHKKFPNRSSEAAIKDCTKAKFFTVLNKRNSRRSVAAVSDHYDFGFEQPKVMF